MASPSTEDADATAKLRQVRFFEQTTTERDARLAQVDVVRQMIALLSGFVDTPDYRGTMVQWTRAIWTAGQATPFPRNGTATTVFDSISKAQELDGDGAYFVRVTDVAGYLSWLKRGHYRTADMPLAVFALSISELSRIVEVPVVHFWIDGLGWMESLEFASPLSGRCYVGIASLWADRYGFIVKM